MTDIKTACRSFSRNEGDDAGYLLRTLSILSRPSTWWDRRWRGDCLRHFCTTKKGEVVLQTHRAHQPR
jgi:hypothetical protein